MENKITSIAHFTPSLPKACGIATYSFAIRKTVKDRLPDLKEFIVAIEDKKEGYKYSAKVKYHFYDQDKADYKKAAEFINKSGAQVVDVQHEFGLYGSKVNPDTLGEDDGQNFLLFLRALKKPAVTTLHMVYRKPVSHHQQIVKEICELSARVVVLSDIAKKFLVDKYSIEPSKIVVIPHGAPNVPSYSTGFFKEMLGFSKKDFLISSFGLIRPKKGYQYLVGAMPEIIKKYPNAKLVIIGRYHPQRSPEYINQLKDQVKEQKLAHHVKFINKFVNYTDLLNYLMATNIFVAPFLVMDQVSSGTLIYAMACGRACVATPFDHAREALADRRGLIVPRQNSKAIADAVTFLIEHPKARHRMQNSAYSYVRKQIWSKTAKRYVEVFNEAIKPEKKWAKTTKEVPPAVTGEK